VKAKAAPHKERGQTRAKATRPAEFPKSRHPTPVESAPVLVATHAVEGGRILQITINRPEVHNAVNGAAARLLLDAWRQFRDDDSLTVAVLHGAGDQAFCSGADLTGLEELARVGVSDETASTGTGPMGGSRLVQVKPVITVSQGYTYAGGLELFCHGHIRLAEPQASFSVACRRWGVPLVDGGTVYLPRLLAWGSALPLIITGQRISAERAFQIGLVWELVRQGSGLERAMSMARQICQQPRDALLADLQSALVGFHLPLRAALELEARNLTPVMQSESTRQGVEAFLQGKRFWFT
jgi:enoyl-CoA hydratase